MSTSIYKLYFLLILFVFLNLSFFLILGLRILKQNNIQESDIPLGQTKNDAERLLHTLLGQFLHRIKELNK